MDLGLANGIYSNKLEGNATGIYHNINTGLHNGIYENINNGIIKKNLLIYYSLNRGDSYLPPYNTTTITDISNSKTNSIIINGSTYSNNGLFLASGQYAIGNATNAILGNNFTIQFTIKPNSIGATNFNIGDFQIGVSSRQGIYFGLDNRTNFLNTFYVATGLTVSYLYTPENSVICNGDNIYNITITCTNCVFSIYINAIQKNGLSLNNILSALTWNSTAFNINRGLGTTSNGITWYNYIVYNRVLTYIEILQNYKSTKALFGL